MKIYKIILSALLIVSFSELTAQNTDMPEFFDSIARIQSIRQQLVVSRFKNIAFADFSLSDDVGFLIAISGKSTRPGTG